MAPPLVLTMSGSTFQRSTHARDCTANASLSSTAATSSQVMPARARAWLTASTGAIPKSCGTSAKVPRPAMRASGSTPIASRAASEPSSTAEAPSLSGEALAGVMVPSVRNDGLRPASFSAVEPGRMPSSLVRSTPSTGTTRSS